MTLNPWTRDRPRMRRVEARHVLVWIHQDGGWRRGSIHCWFVKDDRWMAWMQHQPADPDSPQAVWDLYLYDAETLRRRHHPAAVAHIGVPASWGPGRVIQTRMRNLGYAVALVVTGGDFDILQIG